MKRMLLFTLLVTGNAMAQELPVTPIVIPPAPEATSVFKFSEIPVSLYTGLPEISIPIYKIKIKGLAIPINLRYHARGIRVEEIASRVGIGWSLNYGGMISRQVRGKPDDFSSYTYLGADFYDSFFTDQSTRIQVYDRYVNGEADLEPDQFFLNGISFGGKFIFDQKTKQAVLQHFDDVTITPLFETGFYKIKGWIVVDEKGNKYYYGTLPDDSNVAGDKASVQDFLFSRLNGLKSLINDDEAMYNTWHLRKIETPFNETVTFVYERETPVYYRRSHDIKGEGTDVKCYFSRVSSTQHQIKEIQFENGKVVFTRSAAQREDLASAYSLSKVEVFNNSNELVKGFHFQYHYVTGPTNNNQLAYLKNIDPQSAKRLFLSSIQEFGAGSQTNPPYQFEYNAIPFPNRFSNSQDGWGYYNGASNGQFLTFFNYGTTAVNRTVDVSKSAAGILKKIIYPSGGSVSFSYEHNIAVPPPYLKDLIYQPINPIDTVAEIMMKSPMFYNGSYYSKDFTIGAGLVGYVESDVSFTQPAGCSTTSNLPDCNFRVELEEPDGSYLLFLGDHTHTFLPGDYTLKVIPQNNHDPDDFQNSFVVSLQWEEERSAPDPSDPDAVIYAAGKRIKRIEYWDAASLLTFKEYSYLNAEGKSSGKIFGLPNFYYIQQTIGGVPVIDQYGSRPGSPLTSLQNNNVGYAHVTEYYGEKNVNQGKTEYTFTTYEDAGDFYKFPYHLPADNEWLRGKPLLIKYFANNSGTYVLKRSIQNDYLYANINTVPGVFLNSFEPPGGDPLYLKTSHRFSLPLIIFNDDPDGPLNGANNYKTYHLTGGTANPNSTVETNYESGSTQVTNTTDYYYDNPAHQQVTRSALSRSDGKKEVTLTTYPPDYSNTGGFTGDMKANHLIAYPIEEVTYLESGSSRQLISGRITTYKAGGRGLRSQELILETLEPVAGSAFKFSSRASAGVFPPSGNAAAFAPDWRYAPRLTYNSYDSRGNLRQYKLTDGPATSYLWDYSGAYPVAEVHNAAQNQLAYTSFEAGEKGNWNYSGAAVADASAPTGRRAYALSGGSISKGGLAASRSYLLTYWAKSGSAARISGGAAEVVRSYNGWTQYRRKVSGVSAVTFSGTVRVDALRLHPMDASMKSYTYDPLVGITSETDASGNIRYTSTTISSAWRPSAI